MIRTHDKFSFVKLSKSFRHAMQGVAFAVRTQQNARIHLLAAIIICFTGMWLHIKLADWRWLVSCIVLGWFSEMMNTAFEYLCDVVRPELHESVKRAKDIAAGAVLICAVGVVAISILTFLPYVLNITGNYGAE